MKTNKFLLIAMIAALFLAVYAIANPSDDTSNADPMADLQIVDIKVEGHRTLMLMSDGSLWGNESTQLTTKWINLRQKDVKWFDASGSRIIVWQTDGTVWGGLGDTLRNVRWREIYNGTFD